MDIRPTGASSSGNIVSQIDPSLDNSTRVDYASTNNTATEVSGGLLGSNEHGHPSGTTNHLLQHSHQYDASAQGGHAHHSRGDIGSTDPKKNPLAVLPVPEGGVAIAGQEGLPEGHATAKDKILGNIDKVLAAATFDKAGVQDAKLRIAGGKAAALGEARAPVDHL